MKFVPSLGYRALAAGVVAGCVGVGDGAAQAGGQDAAPFTTASSSEVLVRNGPTGRWAAGEAWSVVEEVRIGSVGTSDRAGPMFTNALIGATLGPEREVFVLDFPADELTRVDNDGRNARRVAREGPGPGELQVPAGMGWDQEKRLWIAGGRGSYTLFDANGELIGTYRRPILGLARRQYPLVFEEGGSFIDEAPEDGGVRFLRLGPDGQILETLGLLSFPNVLPRVLPHQEAFRYVLNHYVPHIRWAVTRHGTVWVTRTDELQLYELDLRTGERIRVVETVHRSGTKLSSEDEDRIREGLREAGRRRDDFQLARPIVQSVHLTGDGYVLVQIVERVGEDGNAFDVFSPQGHFMGTVRMPFRLPRNSGLTVDGETILGVSLTELDEPYVVKARMVRP